jgi:acyl carrier protein
VNLLPILVSTVLEYADVPQESLSSQTNPTLDLNLNSYDMMSILGRLESDLGVHFNERELRNLVTLGDLDDYIRSQLRH